MDNIKRLEEIGLKKVCDETHIEQKYLKYMVDNNYEKLDRIKTLGFVKILSREYKIDLSAWLEAFEEYWLENRKDEEDDGLFIVVDDEKKSKKLLLLILIVLIGATFSLLFSFFQDKVDISNYINSNERNDSSYESKAVIKEAQESLYELNSSLDQSIDEDSMINETNTSEEVIITEDNKTQEVVAETVDEVSAKKETTQEVVKERPEVKESTESTEKVTPKFLHEAIITPNSELWIGVIYLDTKKRRSFIGEGNFSIDISREQIITTGHGSFNVTINGEKREFKKQSPMRFLVKDSDLTEINSSKFKELNEGKSW